ncbi:hypothetical protein EV421DRAFT_245678 [Armillaria borealis]|uniref:Luciferase domain-containing protein n=1 Tax=Armillaria borealis TaxID=47425 RepID=A0AA39IUH7_9AGAR|nr:hypothetical protein EV421DRAFT_245678 [Armillaria borealis]
MGERHPFSGARRVISLPKEYLMIYGPRDDEELAIIERIIKAGVGYMTNCREGHLKQMLDAVKRRECHLIVSSPHISNRVYDRRKVLD